MSVIDVRHPLVPGEVTDRVIAGLRAGHPIVVPVVPVTDSVKRVDDKTILDQSMTTMTANAKFAGSIQGTGGTLVIDHTTDNALATFRLP